MKRFTKKEDAYMRDKYLEKTGIQIAKNLNRAEGSVYGRMKHLGLIVPADIRHKRWSDARKKNMVADAHVFKKGRIPHNKGKEMPSYIYDALKPTMFKKGQKAHNEKYDGAIVIRKDKIGNSYKYIRLSKGNWQLLQREVWKNERGEIPAGMLVKFKDGDSMNCTIDNLYICTRKENMEANSIVRYPTKVITAIRAVARIDKLISKSQKK